MKSLPTIIKAAVVLIFIDLLLLLNYLRKPYFVLGGIFFLDSIKATTIILALVFIAVITGYFILKRCRAIYSLTLFFAFLLILNSVINIIALIFVSDDVAGFLEEIIFGENVFAGFVIMQILFLLINLELYVCVKNARKVLK